MDRDTKRDRELCEKATKGPWVSPWADEATNDNAIMSEGGEMVVGITYYDGERLVCAKPDATFIAESRTALPYYISLCEHLQRMVEAAITFIVELGECPPDGHKACRAIVTPMHEQPAEPPLDFCIQCIRDYLDKKAKEGEKSGN